MQCEFRDKNTGKLDSTDVFQITKIYTREYVAVSKNASGVYRISLNDLSFSLHLRGLVDDDKRLLTQVCSGKIF